MNFSSFLYRQRQRWNYHFANNDVERQIAELNKYTHVVKINRANYFIDEIGISLPKRRFDYIFKSFNLFIANAKNLCGKYVIEDNILLFTWDNFKVNISSASELFIINEIYVEKCYNFLLPEHSKANIIDIGMNVGLASMFFASHLQVDKVFAFEPFKATFHLAHINFNLNPHLKSKIYAHNYGLAGRYSSVLAPFNSNNLGINSISYDNPRTAAANGVESIRICDVAAELDRIFKENQGGDFMIKIDTEGAEYPIFERLFQAKLDSRIIGFMLEWHYKGPNILEDKLVKEGFKVFSTVFNKNTGILYAIR